MKNIVMSFCAIALLCSLVFCKETQGRAVTEIPDSKEARIAAADKFINLYPAEEWRTDILAQIEHQTGPEVTKSFSDNLKKLYSADEIAKFRHKLLTETFTAQELAALTSLLQQNGGKSAIKKAYLLDHKLKAAVVPELSRSLAGQP